MLGQTAYASATFSSSRMSDIEHVKVKNNLFVSDTNKNHILIIANILEETIIKEALNSYKDWEWVYTGGKSQTWSDINSTYQSQWNYIETNIDGSWEEIPTNRKRR